MKMSLMM